MKADDTYDLFFDSNRADRLFVGVKTTGIFCRPGCPARQPKRENCEFFDRASQAVEQGYRACKRCHPLGEDSPILKTLISLIEDTPDFKPTPQVLAHHGIDASTARRKFLSRFGMSLSDYARGRRMARASKTIKSGGSVVDAQLDAGFESPSGFRTAFAKTFGHPPAKSAGEPLFIDWFETPMGRMLAVADDAALYMLEFIERKAMRSQFERLRRIAKRAVLPGHTQIHDQIERELKDYFAGNLRDFTTPLSTWGTDFQTTTWVALQSIPHGETRTYAELAKMIGHPKAVRAVAGANSKNGLALIIPCHRVVASDGGLGGYAGGVNRKQSLLDLERG